MGSVMEDLINQFSFEAMLKWIKSLPDGKIFPSWDMCSCPLAEYLSHITGQPVEVTDSAVSVYPKGENYFLWEYTSPQMEEFVNRYDDLHPLPGHDASQMITKAQVVELLEKLIEEDRS